MVLAGFRFFVGHRRTRWIGWAGLWELFTPDRETFLDVFLLLVGFFITEFLYLKLTADKQAKLLPGP